MPTDYKNMLQEFFTQMNHAVYWYGIIQQREQYAKEGLQKPFTPDELLLATRTRDEALKSVIRMKKMLIKVAKSYDLELLKTKVEDYWEIFMSQDEFKDNHLAEVIAYWESDKCNGTSGV